jgi:long-chain fatty acid transport protein
MGVMDNIKIYSAGVAALMISAASATAGGIEIGRLPYGALFESGRYMELGFSRVSPKVTGEYGGLLAFFGPTTGNMAQDFSSLSFAYKSDLTDQLSYAIMVNTPAGADSKYLEGAYTGLEAHWNSNQIAALLKYKVDPNVSVYGGLRYVRSSATIFIPALLFSPAPLGDYTATGASDGQFGYVIGAAYEIPDIALRVGLTYENAITHKFQATEAFSGIPGTSVSETEVTLPQNLTLDFQTGVAKDTLLFGSVKWAEWSKWHVRPAYYDSIINDEVTGFDHDVFTYQIGLGHRLNDNLSVFARLGYEKAHGTPVSALAPMDGMRSIGVGASWTQDKVKVTGGVEYVELGNAVDKIGTPFRDNTALGFGMTIGFNF